MWVILLILLAVFSYWDMKKKQLPVVWLAAGILFSVVAAVVNSPWEDRLEESGLLVAGTGMILAGMLPGVCFTLLALGTKGKLGCGDGLVLIIIGNLVGAKWCLLIMLLAVMLSFGFSCLLLTVFRKNRNHCFPFVPFYFCGTLAAFVMAAPWRGAL